MIPPHRPNLFLRPCSPKRLLPHTQCRASPRPSLATPQLPKHGKRSLQPPSSGEDISPPSSSEMLNIPRNSTALGQRMTDPAPSGITAGGLSGPDAGATGPLAPRSHDTPPSQPPSLTLSLFTTPGHISVSRVLAVLGINMVLPFINGVMLGFGEIFAREVVKVGKMVYRGEMSLFGWGKGRGKDNRFGGARGVSGVGLSGSGGFP